MPDFDSSSWVNFKSELLSVLDWLVYSFNLIFDEVRSHPMLYIFLFFPIFAFVVFVILDFLLNVVHIQSLFESGDIHTDNSLFKVAASHDNVRSSERAVNLANSAKGSNLKDSTSGVKLAPAASPGSGGSLRSAVSFGSYKVDSNGSSNGSSSRGEGSGKIKPNGAKETHSAQELIKKGIKVYTDSKARKQQDEDMYNKIAAEQEALQARHQAERDKAYNMRVDLYPGQDEEGNSTTRRTETNRRTGEVISSRITVRHDSNSDSDN